MKSWDEFESCALEASSKAEIEECVSNYDRVKDVVETESGTMAITQSGGTKRIGKVEFDQRRRFIDGTELPTMSDNPFIHFLDEHDNPVDNCRCDSRTTEEQEEDFRHRFHSTDLEALESIAEEGLNPETGEKWGMSFGAVFVSENPCNASKWQVRSLMFTQEDCVYEREGDCPLAILRVDEDACDEWKWDERGTTSEYGYSWYCKEEIPPEEIELRTKEGWKPIEELAGEYA